MADSDVLKYCEFCNEKTNQTVSGSGHKSFCHKCETSVEFGYEGK